MIYILLRTGLSGPQLVILGCSLAIVLVFSLSIHEVMHGFVAYKLGDDTAKMQGRLTLNPLAHLDPFGTLMMLIAGFGWAKPVPVNYGKLTRFKNRSVSIRLVSIAGVTSNFAIAFLSYIILSILCVAFTKAGLLHSYDLYFGSFQTIGSSGYLAGVFCELFYLFYFFNLMLMAFNLLPIPPLDGYHFVETFLPYSFRQKLGAYERIIGIILLVLIVGGNFIGFSPLSILINAIEIPFRYVIETSVNALANVISKLL